MIDPDVTPLAGWDSFYVIVGSSGAALIGLQFVVIALIAEVRVRSSHGSIRAFGTPTIIHFGSALLVSTIMSAPWRTLGSVAWALRLVGLIGAIYVAVTMRRAQLQETYKPVWEDWLWHTILPFIAYGVLLAAALFVRAFELDALFIIAAAALSFLFIGIHNAWDTVTYIVIDRPRDAEP